MRDILKYLIKKIIAFSIKHPYRAKTKENSAIGPQSDCINKFLRISRLQRHKSIPIKTANTIINFHDLLRFGIFRILKRVCMSIIHISTCRSNMFPVVAHSVFIEQYFNGEQQFYNCSDINNTVRLVYLRYKSRFNTTSCLTWKQKNILLINNNQRTIGTLYKDVINCVGLIYLCNMLLKTI